MALEVEGSGLRVSGIEDTGLGVDCRGQQEFSFTKRVAVYGFTGVAGPGRSPTEGCAVEAAPPEPTSQHLCFALSPQDKVIMF